MMRAISLLEVLQRVYATDQNKLRFIQKIGYETSNLFTFKKYLSKLFTEHMTLNNYGEWEIDHIKPVSSFNLNNEDELRKCFHYTNLQPLWREDNRRKSNKIIVNVKE